MNYPTLRRSCRGTTAIFMQAYDEAARQYGEGDQAHRVAYAALKQKFEKRGDHWIAKRDPAG